MRIPDVSANAIGEAIEALSQRQPLSKDEIIQYLNKSKGYASNVIIASQELGLIHQDNDAFFLTIEAADLAKATKKQRRNVFKKSLVAFDPFVTFAMLVVKGNSLNDAARKIKVIFNVEDRVDTVLSTLRSWGTYTGVFIRRKSGTYEVEITADELEEQYIKELQEAIQDEMKARVFLALKLQAQAFSYLSDMGKVDAVSALMKYRVQPDDAAKDIGNCFESFLTSVAIDNQVNISRVLGIEQLGNALKSAGLILEQHRKLCAYHAVFRNAADHALDKVTRKPWRIEADCALEIILSTLTSIRSIHTYVTSKDQVL